MSDAVNKAHQATPAATLEQQIMDPNFPKNEREWWAAARIQQLETALRVFACDCTISERCAVPDNCRNFQARRTVEAKCTSS